MPNLTIYYALFSPPARACILTSKLIGLDVELKPVDFAKKEHLSEEFLKLNPQHQVPVLVDEGVPYWDSHAIMAYLVSKYGKDDALYPKDLSTRARVDQRLHYENGVLFQVIKDLVARILYGGETEYNPKTIQNCHAAYEFLEKFLENHDYVVGNHLTIADLSIYTTLITLNLMIPVEKDKYPKITAWLQRLESLPDNAQNKEGAEQLAARIKSFLVQK